MHKEVEDYIKLQRKLFVFKYFHTIRRVYAPQAGPKRASHFG